MAGRQLSPQPTAEQLQAAWQRCCQRRGWPKTYDEAMAHPLYGGLVRMHAIGLARLAQRQQATAQAQADAATGKPAGQQARPRVPRWPAFDPKRLAAGDTDTDHDAT